MNDAQDWYDRAEELDLDSLLEHIGSALSTVPVRTALSGFTPTIDVSVRDLEALIKGYRALDGWYSEVCEQLSIYLCEATNGLLSKSNYSASTMISHADEAYAKRYEDVIREEKREAWEEGVGTAMNYAKRGSDGITLKLVTFDGDAWENPYKEKK